MFITSNYSTWGFESADDLIKQLSLQNVRSVCLIEEHGLGIFEFMNACLKYKIKMSVAYEFYSYVEGFDGKVSGYFLISNPDCLHVIYTILNKLKDDYYPYLSKELLTSLLHSNIYCFIRNGEDVYEYIEYNHCIPLTIKPVSFYRFPSERLRNRFFEYHPTHKNDFLNLISLDPEMFHYRIYSLFSNKLEEYIEVFNPVLQFLYEQDEIEIIQKPSFTFEVHMKKEMIPLLRKHLIQKFSAKHPILFQSMSFKQSISAASKLLFLPHQHLLDAIEDNESVDLSLKKLRLFSVVNVNDAEIINLSTLLYKQKKYKNFAHTNYFVFPIKQSSFYQDTEKCFISSYYLSSLPIPSISFHLLEK
jgi:hypothetical protein